MTRMSELLANKSCQPCSGNTPALSAEQVRVLLANLPGWELKDGAIEKTYRFKNYYETIAFLNAGAQLSHVEDHHPDIQVGYNTLKYRYNTHAIQGLSENDFICAAKLDRVPRPLYK